MQHLGEGLRNPKGTGTPQEAQRSLTWTLGGSQRINHQTKSIQGLDLAATNPAPTYIDVQLGLHLGPPSTGAGAYPDSVACLWTGSLTGQSCLASEGQDILSPQ